MGFPVLCHKCALSFSPLYTTAMCHPSFRWTFAAPRVRKHAEDSGRRGSVKRAAGAFLLRDFRLSGKTFHRTPVAKWSVCAPAHSVGEGHEQGTSACLCPAPWSLNDISDGNECCRLRPSQGVRTHYRSSPVSRLQMQCSARPESPRVLSQSSGRGNLSLPRTSRSIFFPAILSGARGVCRSLELYARFNSLSQP